MNDIIWIEGSYCKVGTGILIERANLVKLFGLNRINDNLFPYTSPTLTIFVWAVQGIF